MWVGRREERMRSHDWAWELVWRIGRCNGGGELTALVLKR